jgi:putative transposase
MVQAVTDQRPTYGHHRVTALLNRTLRQVGNAPVNRKRIYRIRKTHHLFAAAAHGTATPHA